MTKLRTHYDNLKVARDAPDAVIRAAYKVLVQKYHPDKNPGDVRAARVMSLINQSYDVLSDPERRREHDAWIAREEAKLKEQEQERRTADQNRPPPSTTIVLNESMAFKDELKRRFFDFLISPPGLMGCLLLGLTFLGLLSNGWSLSAPSLKSSNSPQSVSPPRPLPANNKPVYTRPGTAPNGSQWPSRAGYVKGYPVDSRDGRSEVTVDNTQNDADVFVKLVSLEGETAYPVRQFYIPSGAKFTMNKVDAGQYDLRYLDLATGKLSRSESFEVEERRTATGIEYSVMTMSLYKVRDGNFHTYDLAAEEF